MSMNVDIQVKTKCVACSMQFAQMNTDQWVKVSGVNVTLDMVAIHTLIAPVSFIRISIAF